MTPEQKQIYEDAIGLCRSANNIANRYGKDTNWVAFAGKAERVLDAYYDQDRTEAHRVAFETWVRNEPFFAHPEGGALDRDGDGYINATVHGAWMGYLAHVPKPCPPAPPCDYFDQPSVPLAAPVANFQLPKVPVPPGKPTSEDEIGYPSDE